MKSRLRKWLLGDLEDRVQGNEQRLITCEARLDVREKHAKRLKGSFLKLSDLLKRYDR